VTCDDLFDHSTKIDFCHVVSFQSYVR
jgi:hypothetical protein